MSRAVLHAKGRFPEARAALAAATKAWMDGGLQPAGAFILTTLLFLLQSFFTTSMVLRYREYGSICTVR